MAMRCDVNAHYDERCFLPIHVYDADTGHCVLTILRPGKTPDGGGECIGGWWRSVIGNTRITIRGTVLGERRMDGGEDGIYLACHNAVWPRGLQTMSVVGWTGLDVVGYTGNYAANPG